jgi:CRISPR-associated endonuclease cas1, NMENI subtype
MWRTVAITNRAKLDLKLNYLVIRAQEEHSIHLSEINTLIIENTAVSLTAALIVELSKRKIKVIFCDEKRNPISENTLYYGSHDTSLKIKKQVKWQKETKENIWTNIVKSKIEKQKQLLEEIEKYDVAEKLDKYISTVQLNDSTNREGQASKIYFTSLFGENFTRETDNTINAALNYGYSIILSIFNRVIVSNGYITQLGIFHDNRFNQYNLSSDMMEPYRILIDRCVVKGCFNEFNKIEKIQLLKILEQEVLIDNKKQVLLNSIDIYCKSIFSALEENNERLIKFYKYEL